MNLCPNGCDYIFNYFSEHFPGQTHVLSSKLDTPFEIPLTLEEKTISHGYQSKLRTFGLDFEFSARGKHIQYDDESHEHVDTAVETYLWVTHVPKCFAIREENELKYNRSFSMAEMTTKLVKEIIDKIKITRGGGLGIMPKSINDVLNSRACRGELILYFNKSAIS